MTNEERLESLKKEMATRFWSKIEQSLGLIIKSVPGLEAVYLFGSVARREPKWDSDVDLAVITKEPLTDHYVRGMIIDELDWPNEDGVRADVIFRTEDFVGGSPTFETLYNRDKELIWRKSDD